MLKILQQQNNSNIYQGRQSRGAEGAIAPPIFREFCLFSQKCNPKNVKIWMILCLSPSQSLHRPLNDLEIAPAL